MSHMADVTATEVAPPIITPFNQLSVILRDGITADYLASPSDRRYSLYSYRATGLQIEDNGVAWSFPTLGNRGALFYFV